MSWRRWAGVVGGLGTFVAALTLTVMSRQESSRVGAEVFVEATETFSAETLQDWVSIADAVVRVQVTDVVKYDSRDAEQLASGEGALGRRVTVAVLETLWQRNDGAHPPAGMQFDTLGWVTNGGKERRMVVGDKSKLDLNQEYIFPAVYLMEEETWAPLTTSSVVEISPGSRGVPPIPASPGVPEALIQISGKSLEELPRILSGTQPYAGLGGLDPFERQAKAHGGDVRQIREARGLPAVRP